MPDAGPTPEGQLDYEKLIAPEATEFDWPRLDENVAAPILLHVGHHRQPEGRRLQPPLERRCTRSGACLADSLGVSMKDTILPVVPMFHANAWGLPHACAAVGAKIVFPGPKLDPASLLDLMASERVTCAGGVPTIWLGILALLDEHPKKWDLSSLRQMVVGGSAAPPSMIDGFQKRHGLTVTHAWGMTETSPSAPSPGSSRRWQA